MTIKLCQNKARENLEKDKKGKDLSVSLRSDKRAIIKF